MASSAEGASSRARHPLPHLARSPLLGWRVSITDQDDLGQGEIMDFSEALLGPGPWKRAVTALDLVRGVEPKDRDGTAILTLDVGLEWGPWSEGPWTCQIEIQAQADLFDLHDAIRRAVGFDDEHLFGFYVATKSTGPRHWLTDGDDEQLDLPLSAIWPLKKRYALFYYYDFGDSWCFRVGRARRAAFPAQAGVDYPRLLASSGTRPDQYG